jgi:hypothetical protein
MLPDPEPRPEPRWFNAKEFIVWEGRASLLDLEGWVDNPRIDIPVELFKEENLGREPNNEELLDIMLDLSAGERGGDEHDGDEDNADTRRSRKNKLLELAESIRLSIAAPCVPPVIG